MARKVYDRQFKEEACKLVSERGYSVNKAANELGVASMTLQYWLKKRGQAPASAPESNDPQVLKTRPHCRSENCTPMPARIVGEFRGVE